MPNLFKLEKLKISGFKDSGRKDEIDDPSEIEAMFNPASFQETYKLSWSRNPWRWYNSSGQAAEYSYTPPEELTVDLVFDGTSVSELGLIQLPLFKKESVADKVKQFLNVAFHYNGEIHEPNYLLITWGNLNFPCRLQNVTINYNLFDRDGTPLRADLKAAFIADKDAQRQAKLERKSSPDLTHACVVRQGDILPLLTRRIYGSSERYLDVARFNGLDHFRNLTPGRQILFPPLDRLASGGTDGG